MENRNDEMITAEEKLKTALIEILNHPDNLARFSEVFTNFDSLARKTMTIEFKLFDIEAQSTNVAQANTVQFLSAPLSPISTQFGTTWCAFPDCSPPPGRFI